MLFGAFFSWWYGRGWKLVIASFSSRSQTILELFSVGQISRTMFAPWRRIITYPGVSLAEKVRAWGDNLFSRVIGFIVRLFVLFAAVLTLLFVALATGVEVVVWPLVPPAVPLLLIIGVVL